MIYEQGDILSLNFDPSVRHEPSGRHYCIVLSPWHVNNRCALTTVVPITSRDNGYPFHVPLNEGNPITGFAQCEAIRAIDLGMRFAQGRVEHVGEIDDDTLADILARVLVLLGLEPFD